MNPPSPRDALLRQAAACRALGSPFNALVCESLASSLTEESRFGRRILAWPGDPVKDAMALRAAGGLHWLARSGRCPSLSGAYPPNPTDQGGLLDALSRAIREHDDVLHDYLDSPPQTNEVKRSAALLGGCLAIAASTGLPLSILEIGASAGLNLGFDKYYYTVGPSTSWGDDQASVHISSEWTGRLPPLDAPLRIVGRRGCDLNPLDPRSGIDRERLLSYIWPDQAERLAITSAALDAAGTAQWQVERADAAQWVERKLGDLPADGVVRVLVHTIVWQYLPPETQSRIAQIVQGLGKLAEPASPLAWLRMEADGRDDSAAISLTMWPGSREWALGRADFHGRWIQWDASLPARGAERARPADEG